MIYVYSLKKTVFGALLILAVLTILFLTFQDSAGTVRLSEGIRLWLEQFGIHSDFHSFRSNAHLVVYFIFGVVLSLYGREAGWKWWIIMIVGCGFGLFDEGLKIWLPTREFDVVDLMKDWIGIIVSSVLMLAIRKSCRCETSSAKSTQPRQ